MRLADRYSLGVALLVGVLGPVAALLVTWKPALEIARMADMAGVAEPRSVSADLVEELRSAPASGVLSRIREVAIWAPEFRSRADRETVAAAQRLLREGVFSVDGEARAVSVPFRRSENIFQQSAWHLSLCSFVVPALLSRAYEVTGDDTYLRAALDYVLDWSAFESSLMIPQGYVFNDHATAARAVVATELWRLYRNSRIFATADAAKLLAYVEQLGMLLRSPQLYEYRTNHGLMQSLALLHLAVAFPSLPGTAPNTATGKERLLSQMEYFVNGEGVILENSAGYHYHGLQFLEAARAYLEALDGRLPPAVAERYDAALEFYSNLARPDGTLPVIGDTDDTGYRSMPAVDDTGAPARAPRSPPDPFVVKPSAGYAIAWGGLAHWPDQAQLVQTVLHWANFVSGAHNHADEPGLTLWAGGTDWLRSVGYWPYDSTRAGATGWRSSNAPHWRGEAAAGVRKSILVARARDEGLWYFDAVRKNDDGREIRRQVVGLQNRLWIVLDNFHSGSPGTAEIVWRSSPGVTLRELEPNGYSLEAPDNPRSVGLRLGAAQPMDVEPDPQGAADWNSGVSSNRTITASPAIRVSSLAQEPVFLAVFELHQRDGPGPAAGRLEWLSANEWTVSLGEDGPAARVERRGDSIKTTGTDGAVTEVPITRVASAAMQYEDAALRSFSMAADRFGTPFTLNLQRRRRMTALVAALAVVQVPVMVLAHARFSRWRYAFLAMAAAGWAGLTVFIVIWLS